MEAEGGAGPNPTSPIRGPPRHPDEATLAQDDMKGNDN